MPPPVIQGNLNPFDNDKFRKSLPPEQRNVVASAATISKSTKQVALSTLIAFSSGSDRSSNPMPQRWFSGFPFVVRFFRPFQRKGALRRGFMAREILPSVYSYESFLHKSAAACVAKCRSPTEMTPPTSRPFWKITLKLPPISHNTSSIPSCVSRSTPSP